MTEHQPDRLGAFGVAVVFMAFALLALWGAVPKSKLLTAQRQNQQVTWTRAVEVWGWTVFLSTTQLPEESDGPPRSPGGWWRSALLDKEAEATYGIMVDSARSRVLGPPL